MFLNSLLWTVLIIISLLLTKILQLTTLFLFNMFSCSDDGTVRVWDFFSCYEEKVLRGHGADVKCVDWHPTQGLLASGSKGKVKKFHKICNS